MKMTPEADDYSGTVAAPSLRRSAGEAGRVRGGFRRRHVHHPSDLRGFEHAHTRRARDDETEEQLTESSTERGPVRSPAGRGQRVTDNKSGVRRPPHEDNIGDDEEQRSSPDGKVEATSGDGKVEATGGDGMVEATGGDDGESVDWRDRGDRKRVRERDVDKLLDELAFHRYIPGGSRGESPGPGVAPLSPSEDVGVRAAREDETAPPRENAIARNNAISRNNATPKIPLSIPKTISKAGEKTAEPPRLLGPTAAGRGAEPMRLPGIPAAEKQLSAQEAALVGKRGAYSTRDRQLFVGLLNVEGGRLHSSRCATAVARDVFELVSPVSAKLVRSDKCAESQVDETWESEPESAYNGETTDVCVVLATKAGRGSDDGSDGERDTLPTGTAKKPAGHAESAHVSEMTGGRDGKALRGTRGRTLLDFSGATMYRTEQQGRTNRPEGRGVHRKPRNNQLHLHVSNEDVFSRSRGTSRDSQSPSSEDSICTDFSCFQCDSCDAAGNCHDPTKDRASFPSDSGTTCAAHSVSEDGPVTISGTRSCGRCESVGNDDNTCKHEPRFGEAFCETHAEANNALGRARAETTAQGRARADPVRTEVPSETFTKSGEFSPMPSEGVADAEENSVVVSRACSCLAESDRQTDVSAADRPSTGAVEADSSDWKTHLAMWRNAARHASLIPSRRVRPTSFPWDEDVIPACRGKAKPPTAGAKCASFADQGSFHADGTHEELTNVVKNSDGGSGEHSTTADGGRPLESAEKRAVAFLRRRSGTGGGRYAQGHTCCTSDTETQAKSVHTIPRKELSAGASSKKDQGHMDSSRLQPLTDARSDVGRKEGINFYTAERAVVLASWGRLPANDTPAAAGKATPAAALAHRLPSERDGAQRSAMSKPRRHNKVTREAEERPVRLDKSLSMCTPVHEGASRVSTRCTRDCSANTPLSAMYTTTADPGQRCLSLKEHVAGCFPSILDECPSSRLPVSTTTTTTKSPIPKRYGKRGTQSQCRTGRRSHISTSSAGTQ